jgi:hypothetical protein
MSAHDWESFIDGLRSDQEKLRKELRPYEAGTMRVGRGPPNGPMEDFTDERIATIKGEIERIERTLRWVEAMLQAEDG